MAVVAQGSRRSDDRWAMFVVDESRAVQRELRIGRRSGLGTQIATGVKPGGIVISCPRDRVGDGFPVDAAIGTD